MKKLLDNISYINYKDKTFLLNDKLKDKILAIISQESVKQSPKEVI